MRCSPQGSGGYPPAYVRMRRKGEEDEEREIRGDEEERETRAPPTCVCSWGPRLPTRCSWGYSAPPSSDSWSRRCPRRRTAGPPARQRRRCYGDSACWRWPSMRCSARPIGTQREGKGDCIGCQWQLCLFIQRGGFIQSDVEIVHVESTAEDRGSVVCSSSSV